LTGVQPDLVFIDGGHSITTISQDWEAVKKVIHSDSIVIFDDYYLSDNPEFLKAFGCNAVVESIGAYRLSTTSDSIRKRPFHAIHTVEVSRWVTEIS